MKVVKTMSVVVVLAVLLGMSTGCSLNINMGDAVTTDKVPFAEEIEEYVSDGRTAINTFVAGDVDIELICEQDSDCLFIPGHRNDKRVSVKNTGEDEAYVRVHFAVPVFERNGEPLYPFKLSRTVASDGDGRWCWGKNAESSDLTSDEDFNSYTTTIEGNKYKVFVATYDLPLAPGETTPLAIDGVLIKGDISLGEVTMFSEQYGGNMMHTMAEACAIGGSDDPFHMLDNLHGVIGEYEPFDKTEK